MASNIDEATTPDGFNPFRYMVAYGKEHEHNMDLAQYMTFKDRCKEVARLKGGKLK